MNSSFQSLSSNSAEELSKEHLKEQLRKMQEDPVEEQRFRKVLEQGINETHRAYINSILAGVIGFDKNGTPFNTEDRSDYIAFFKELLKGTQICETNDLQDVDMDFTASFKQGSQDDAFSKEEIKQRTRSAAEALFKTTEELEKGDKFVAETIASIRRNGALWIKVIEEDMNARK